MSVGQRSGFTLIEVLVVVSIIGVLVGLLLPAVQGAREAARMTLCQNNMVQIHLSVQGYHTAFDRFPAGTVTDRLPARLFPDGKDHSWLVQTRPFLAGGNAFEETWSSDHSSYHPTNWPLVAMASTAIACPSNPSSFRSDVVPLCYAGVHDGRDVPIDHDNRGFFVANRYLTIGDVNDGLSSTLQIGEKPVDIGGSFFWTSGNQSSLRSTAIDMKVPGAEHFRLRGGTRLGTPYGMFADPPGRSYDEISSELAEMDGDLESDLIFLLGDEFGMAEVGARSEYHAEFEILDYPVPVIGDRSTAALGFASVHSGKVNFVFADGRIATITNSIDAQLMRQLAIRDDSLPLSNPLLGATP